MPWEHCDKKNLDDDGKCPECGITKKQWTLEWNVTRTFQVTKGSGGFLKVILHDANDKPIPNAAYVVELPDGKTLKGNLDKVGSAKIKTGVTGQVKVKFPELDPKAWEKSAAGGQPAAAQKGSPPAKST